MIFGCNFRQEGERQKRDFAFASPFFDCPFYIFHFSYFLLRWLSTTGYPAERVKRVTRDPQAVCCWLVKLTVWRFAEHWQEAPHPTLNPFFIKAFGSCNSWFSKIAKNRVSCSFFPSIFAQKPRANNAIEKSIMLNYFPVLILIPCSSVLYSSVPPRLHFRVLITGRLFGLLNEI